MKQEYILIFFLCHFEDNLPSEFKIDISNNIYNQKTGLYYIEEVMNLASYIKMQT